MKFFIVLLAAVLLMFCSCGAETSDVLALYNCRIIDGNGGTPVDNGVIVIKGDKIDNIGAAKEVSIPWDCKKLDLEGASILPGFINSHVHKAYDAVTLQNWLKGGVTTVRDLGPFSNSDYIKKRDEFNRDLQNARIIAATPLITKPGGYGGLFVESPEDAAAKVNGLIDYGADIIKIALEDDLQGRTWPMMSPEEAKSIVAAAHARNKRVSAHVSHVRNLPVAIDAGVDDIAHMVVEPMENELINKIVEKDIYWVPTLELWQGVSKIHSLDWDSIAADNLSRFFKAGGKVALGTDFAGYICSFDKGFPITEVTLLKKAGLSNMDIIVAATKNAAYVSDREKHLGTLEKGKIADCIVITGNPLENMELLKEPQMVIHNGKIAYKKGGIIE